jgi:hypothetical protein
MNKIEKVIYDVLKKYPRFKIKIRNYYQLLFDFIPDSDNYFIGNIQCREGFFFGFHDCTPFSVDDKHILANKLMIDLRMPKPNDPLGIGFWDENYKNYVKVDTSYAWNFHKGCRLQWLGNKPGKLIYNTMISDKLRSIVYDCNQKSKHIINYPIDTVSPDGKYATSFSYYRLEKLMPGYGYSCHDEPYLEEKISKNTGMYLVDLTRNDRRLLIDLYSLSKIQSDKSMVNSNHFVTHSMFSPDGKYVAFLHRWIKNDVLKRWSRLVCVHVETGAVYISPTTGMVSHYVWNSKNGIIAYCQVGGVDGQYQFASYSLENPKLIGARILNSDGHQHFVGDTSSFVTDTYPDKRRNAMLYHVNIDKNVVTNIARIKSYRKFQSPSAEKHWACDLHPRTNRSGSIVCFDSVHTGTRSMCFMKMDIIGV